MSLHVDGVGSAKRKRVQRLRSWLRHEQQTVAIALAENLHHSTQRVTEPHNVPREPTKASAREGEVREAYDVLREQKPPLPGERPAPLSEVAGPLAAVTVGNVAAEAPSLVVALVAAHDGLDQVTVHFLLQQSLLARAEEEEEAREQVELRQLEGAVSLAEVRLLDELAGQPWRPAFLDCHAGRGDVAGDQG